MQKQQPSQAAEFFQWIGGVLVLLLVILLVGKGIDALRKKPEVDIDKAIEKAFAMPNAPTADAPKSPSEPTPAKATRAEARAFKNFTDAHNAWIGEFNVALKNSPKSDPVYYFTRFRDAVRDYEARLAPVKADDMPRAVAPLYAEHRTRVTYTHNALNGFLRTIGGYAPESFASDFDNENFASVAMKFGRALGGDLENQANAVAGSIDAINTSFFGILDTAAQARLIDLQHVEGGRTWKWIAK
ncbi:MAG: hypothetical protein KDA20_05995 [Phycisphaerales bacterium]|nr:hypothetical protein [Phycisphaerales bacterium]